MKSFESDFKAKYCSNIHKTYSKIFVQSQSLYLISLHFNRNSKTHTTEIGFTRLYYIVL